MVVYSFDGVTGRFIAGEMADPDPMDPGRFLIPANSTTEIPPEPYGPFWPYWKNGGWAWVDEGTSELERSIRTRRNQALIASDWTQLPDVAMSVQMRKNWRLYRQALRDLPKHPAWPFLELPEKPV